MSEEKFPAPIDDKDIQKMIYIFRGKQVMVDSDLAKLYQVETKYLNRQRSRNADRFPDDFCFQLTKEEYEVLRRQNVTSKSETGSGGRRYFPYVFTEQGIAMLSSVYHIGASIKDAGKKSFRITKIEDDTLIKSLLKKIK